jgi:hypothetical protein
VTAYTRTSFVYVDQKIACLKREITRRRWAYSAEIGAGRMTLGKANHEIFLMEAILQDYLMRADLAKADERSQPKPRPPSQPLRVV